MLKPSTQQLRANRYPIPSRDLRGKGGIKGTVRRKYFKADRKRVADAVRKERMDFGHSIARYSKRMGQFPAV